MHEIPEGKQRAASPAEEYSQVRQRILSLPPESFGIAPSAQWNDAWGLLMEFRSRDVFVTFASTADGDTSLYFSNGASVLGGGTHPNVAKAACELLAMAPRFRFVMEQLAGKQRRSSRNVRFDLLTFSGNLTADAPEAELLDGSDALAPLFFKVHEAITELRVATEARRY